MTCALDTYRTSVGSFAFILCKILSKRADTARQRIKGLRAEGFAAKLTILTLLTLLFIGCVELNPGPDSTLNDTTSQQSGGSNGNPVNDHTCVENSNMTGIQAALQSLTQAMSRVETSQARLESSLKDRLQKLDDKIGSRLDELSRNQDIINGDVDELSNKYETMEAVNERLQSRITDLEEKLDMAENRSRRCNLLFWGIPTAVRETWDDCERKVLDIIHNTLDISDNIVIERAHRVGKAIIVAFRYFKDRQRVLSRGSKLKGTDIIMREDLSLPVRRKRQGLSSLQKSLRDDGKRALFSFDKLKTDDGIYTFDLSDNTNKNAT